MPRDLHGFAEKAIEIAGLAGEKKRRFKVAIASSLAESRMDELKRVEKGETKRAELREAGLRERLGREQEFARPLQRAEIGRLGALGGLREAETEKTRYGTEFERGVRGTAEDILRTQAGLGEEKLLEARLGRREEERRIEFRDEAEVEAARPTAPEAEAEVIAEPGRRMRPGLKKFLWEGWPERGLPGLGAPVKGYLDIAELLGTGARKGYEYAFPRSR